ncbi:MAG: DUF134 domain-containing protein [Lachnospiraceae bacterium]|nr:DUF134 domain-containing protein [Lachnospiraceae bacterium]
MARPKRCRKICGYPDYWSFVPESTGDFETVFFMLDEFETIRLIDYQKMTQEECAVAMGVSRATVTSIYESARFKLSDAMVNGKRIQITGGSYKIEEIPANISINLKGESVMRIAVTYEQGQVGQHFGRTEQFKLYDADNGEIKSSQIIDTNGTGHGALAGFLRASEVDVLICGGIGMGARNVLMEAGIQVLPGVDGEADIMVNDYLAGKLVYDPDTECHHHDHEHGEGHECHHGDCGSHGCN